MKSSFFKEAIRLQFNALMMITIKGTLKQNRKLLARRFRQEILFCEMGEAKLNEHGDYSGSPAHPGRSSAQPDRASAHLIRSAVQLMPVADQHTC